MYTIIVSFFNDGVGMEKKIEIGWLLEFYGKLLTDKQQNIMSLYFNEDIGLSEIGDMMGVTRQAVRDIISRSEKLLYDYESKLGLLQQFKHTSSLLKEISKKIQNLEGNEKEKELITQDMDRLIEMWEE